MSERLRREMAKNKEYTEQTRRMKEEHRRYQFCLVTIDEFSGPLTVAEIKKVVHAALQAEREGLS